MNLTTPRIETHPDPREEVMAMDDVDVDVTTVSIGSTSKRKERMGNND